MSSSDIFNMSTTEAAILDITAALLGSNETHGSPNSTLNATSLVHAHRSGKGQLSVVFKVVYVIGILGNAAAIITLRMGERRVKNRKHLLLLTSLAANDLVALLGMLCTMVVGELVPHTTRTWQFCAARVLLRVFGIGSVCIAVTMALERYLALTRPFLYQKQVTYYMIRTALILSWVWACVFTCAPLLGLGSYYDPSAVLYRGDPQRGGCVRYREADSPTDIVYAGFYIAFGTLLCVVLVYCNLAVIRALYAITAPRAAGPGAPVVRRVSKSSCRARRDASRAALPGLVHNAATAEEVAFSYFMATLSVLFMICWMPQMITSTLYLSMPSKPKWLNMFSNWSDGLMLFNYVLNPVLYVLIRRRRASAANAAPAAAALCRDLVQCFKRSHKRSTESMSIKTSCCQQDTVVVSDSSGAEMRPLRASHAPDGTLINIDDHY